MKETKALKTALEGSIYLGMSIWIDSLERGLGRLRCGLGTVCRDAGAEYQRLKNILLLHHLYSTTGQGSWCHAYDIFQMATGARKKQGPLDLLYLFTSESDLFLQQQ